MLEGRRGKERRGCSRGAAGLVSSRRGGSERGEDALFALRQSENEVSSSAHTSSYSEHTYTLCHDFLALHPPPLLSLSLSTL